MKVDNRVPSEGAVETKLTAYEAWQRGEGVPIHKGFYIEDLRTAEVGPWDRVGGKGCVINLGGQEQDDCHVIEIPPGGALNPHRYLWEEFVFVVDGRGTTTIWREGQPKRTVEWQQGSVFSPPLNCWRQHFNADGQRPARLMVVTTAPLMMNLFHNHDFIFNNPFEFTDRYNSEPDYFTDPGRAIGLGGRLWKTNLVPDVRSFGHMTQWKERGAGGTNVMFAIGHNTLSAHISEFPVGTYKKAHRHNAGAHVTIIGGEGYSLLWREGFEKDRVRIDWHDCSVFSPPDMWYHQHFNVGRTPARYYAITWLSEEHPINGEWYRTFREQDQIQYEDQEPFIHELFEQEVRKRGGEVVLPRPQYRQR